jgi:hypothetical protein
MNAQALMGIASLGEQLLISYRANAATILRRNGEYNNEQNPNA